MRARSRNRENNGKRGDRERGREREKWRYAMALATEGCSQTSRAIVARCGSVQLSPPPPLSLSLSLSVLPACRWRSARCCIGVFGRGAREDDDGGANVVSTDHAARVYR